jgi:hypothetical protein
MALTAPPTRDSKHLSITFFLRISALSFLAIDQLLRAETRLDIKELHH